MSKTKSYMAALYLRLSRDDADIDGRNKTESNSISSQRELLKGYVKSREDIKIYDVYIDDGYSGADFHRPEFARMMEDICTQKVNCVIVKDLSRFGRDYIEAGRFIQKIFPAFQVRFIAITDGYDSIAADKTEQSFVLPIKNFVNDSYCRDISVKVKAQQKVKRLEGKCISAFTVYGYLKNPKNKNQLMVDDYAADVVKQIFSWKIEGMSFGAIANKLNNFGILSPMEYKKFLGMKFATGFAGTKTAGWSAVSVKRILTNRVYIGYMEQGKQEKISYKINKRIVKPEEEWIRIKDMHEPVISKADFYLVQNLLQFDGRVSDGTETAHFFSGILICGDCRAPMMKRVNTYKGKKTVFYICQTKHKSQECSRHSVREDILKNILLKEIKLWLGFLASDANLADVWNQIHTNTERIEKYYEHISGLKKEYNKYCELKKVVLSDWKEGLIEEEEQKELYCWYTKKCKEYELAINKQEKLVKTIEKSAARIEKKLAGYKETKGLEELSRELLVRMVDKIYVYEDKKLDIFFRFSKVVEKSNIMADIVKKENLK